MPTLPSRRGRRGRRGAAPHRYAFRVTETVSGAYRVVVVVAAPPDSETLVTWMRRPVTLNVVFWKRT